jgi:putative aldouronate transport system permease protein
MTTLQTAAPKRRLRSVTAKKKTFWLTTMMLPGAVWLLLIRYLPMFGIVIAFKNYRAFRPNTFWNNIVRSEWVGLKNFEFLNSPDTGIMIRNTLLYNIFWIILGAVLGVTAAILINEVVGKLKKKFYMTAILLPYLMSMVVIAYLVYAYLSPTSGLFTKALERWTGSAPAFYQETKWWPFVLTFVNQWRQIGFGMILYMSTILGIDPSLYEAATLDGATRWQQHKKITIPLMIPTIVMLFILSLGQIFRSDFGLFYQVPMNQGSLYSVTQTIDTYVYRALLKTNDVGMSSAASFVQSVVGFIFIVGANKVVSHLDENSKLF